MHDWTDIEHPSQQEIEAWSVIPGVRFDFAAGKVVNARLHRSAWIPAKVFVSEDPRLPPSPGVVDFERKSYLRPYQQWDLPFLLTRRSSILGYEMRLGKTATACAAHNRDAGPLLVIGPLIARDVWRHWIERVHGFSPVCLESKTDVALPGFPAYFVHFDILDSHSAFLQTLKPATLIIDEIHMLQARRSLRMTTCSLIAQHAQRIIGLSGTPMWSNPRSMWPILNLLAPGAWGTEFDFCQRYMHASRGAWGWMYNGTQNEEEFKQRLSEVIVRRTWKDVAPSLPPTINVVEPVAVTNRDRNQLELAAEKARLASTNVNSRTSQVAHLATLRKRYGMLKVERAVELAIQSMRDGHKVVLWTWHIEVAEELVQKIGEAIAPINGAAVAFEYITADQTQDVRAARIKRFQTDDYMGCIVVPLAVGGVAIDLSSADVNIFVELDWIPATNYQASMRVFSPARPHSNVFLFADVPVERRLMEVLGVNEACQSAMALGYDEIAVKVLG